uniref:Charged multivesicular body protein 3 (inferred by orthology to a zebrafish protein) n=2 Tax=Strongyloides TaxID=6247 RepID=A0A0K0F7V6_STRVS
MGLFGLSKKPDPKDQIKELQRKMRNEMRALDRQIHQIEREEEKVKREIKEAVKKGDKDVCKVLAKGIVRSRKAISRIYASKAQINGIIMSMSHQLSSMRMAGSIKASTDVMQQMSNLVKVPEIAATMREMSREMTKIGIIDEMIDNTMESMDPEDIEELADIEVENTLWEITKGELGKAPTAQTNELGDGMIEYRKEADKMLDSLNALNN